MSFKATDKRLRNRIPHAPLFIALCGLVVALAAGTAFAGLPEQGKRPPQPALKIGQTKHSPSPLCPKDCQAVGSVTGFQLKADNKKQLMRVPHNARIVAWAVSVANTSKKQEKIFGSDDFFGSPKYGRDPIASLAILKKMKNQGPKFRLVRSSPLMNLNFAQGHKQYFVLKKPLKAKKGMIVGITVPTWAPIFAGGSAGKNAWKASRNPKKCSGDQNALDARPQIKKKSVRKYGCRFSGTRLLYWAYYIRGLGGG
jgi:hypothetical protein